ncbi:MAG: FGGY family carbohydrate kinase [Oscillospiraceae bacterium]|nr:FGGY family carbohydrate kinase [Oscillospiraceae bacterium]
MERGYILGFDFGTGGLKAVLTSLDGELLGTAGRSYSLLVSKISFAEQDPEVYWNAACECTRELIKKTGIDGARVLGMSLCTQGMGLIPLDENCRPLYNTITFLDGRAGEQADYINGQLGCAFATPTTVAAKYLWLRQHLPYLFQRTAWFADCTGYITYKASGKLHMELTNSGPYSLDPEQRAFKKKLYQIAGVEETRIPPLKLCAEYVGNLTPEAADELGLTTGTRIYMGTGDVPGAAAGAGCLLEGDAHICFSTSGWLSVMTGAKRLDSVSPGAYQIYSINKDVLIYGGGTQSAGRMLDWAIDQFYREEKNRMGRKIYDFVSGQAEQVPRGSGSLIATSWLCGENFPICDENAKAVFFNMTNLHDRRHILNAVMEGVCYSLRGQLDCFREDTGKDIQTLVAVGGGAGDPFWMQMAADILQVPVRVTQSPRYAGAIGSALTAGIGMGLYGYRGAAAFVRIKDTFYPRERYAAVYDRMYGMFKKLYPALKPLYDEYNGKTFRQ